MYRKFVVVAIGVCLMVLAGCGSGNTPSPTPGVTTTPSPATPPAPPAPSLSPARARVLLGSTQQFNTSVPNPTWEVSGIPGGNDVYGTISSSGLYTAPAVVPTNPVVGVDARSGSAVLYSFVDIGSLAGTQFAYVSSAVDNDIQVFKADARTGMLSPSSLFPVVPGTAPTALAVSRNGKYLYSLNRGSNDISIFVIDAATGDLSGAGTVPTPSGPYALEFSAKGDFAYLSCDSAATIAAFSVNLSTGALIPLSGGDYVAAGSRIQSLAISDDGKFLYATNTASNQILGFAVNQTDGQLTTLAGSPYSTATGVTSMASVFGDVYISDDNGVESYTPASTGDLKLSVTGSNPNFGKSVVLLPNMPSPALIGANAQSTGILASYIDFVGGAGSVTSAASGAFPVAGRWMWNDTGLSNWLYVLNRQADTSSTLGSISVYKLDETKGLVGPITTIPTTLNHPSGFVTTP